jgi:hypothetical protein
LLPQVRIALSRVLYIAALFKGRYVVGSFRLSEPLKTAIYYFIFLKINYSTGRMKKMKMTQKYRCVA